MALTIPDGIKLTRSKADEKLFTGRLRVWLESEPRSDTIHASELLDPRMGFWSRKMPKPLTDRDVMVFFIGKGLHEKALPNDGNSDTGESTHEGFGITYSPDERRDGIPRELKTTRSFYEPKEVKDVSLYLEQLQIYMACEDTLKGGLDIVYINLKEDGKTSPSVRSLTVEYTPEQMQDVKDEILVTVGQIRGAIESGDPSDLPLCRQFKCAEACKWWGDCQPPGRYPSTDKKQWIA